MRRKRVLLRFLGFPVPEKIEFYGRVIACMTGNPNFPEPDVLLTLLTTALTTLTTDYKAAMSGSHEAKSKLRDSEKAADELFRLEALYVDRIAKGNETIILSSGYESTSQPNPALRPVFSVQLGENPGEVILRCKRVPGARSYIWQFCTGNEPKEESFVFAGSGTTTTFVIKDLILLTRYWFRGCAVTPEGMQPWFDPISKTL